jgi:hypothetical protein
MHVESGSDRTEVQGGKRMMEGFDKGWRFHFGDVSSAKEVAFDDADWQAVRLPHDWSVEQSFSEENTGGCTGFLPGGIGWYRKTFSVPASSRGQGVRIDFDGVYNNSDVWINGHHLGRRPFGYIPFSYNLSEHLNYGGVNTIAVRADRSAYMDCRWYPGSGIYRSVQLVTHHPVHLQQYGFFITTAGNHVTVKTTVVNGSGSAQTIDIAIGLQDAGGQSVGFQPQEMLLKAGETNEVIQLFKLEKPVLWEPDNPYLYSAEVELTVGGTSVDRVSTPFGVRDVRYDADAGFFLNGKNTLFKGVCLHHDGGCVGAAVPIAVWERRLRILKEGGCNAIRTAHNPPSAEFLDLCDRMGFLVQDEAFDEWFNPKDKKYNFNQRVDDERTIGYSAAFGEWAERDVKAMVLRDRNHPCIVMWSTGNEIEWTYPVYSEATGYWLPENEGKVDFFWDEPLYSDAELKQRYDDLKQRQGEHILSEQAAALSRWVKEVDSSRPVTANVVIPSISHFSGYTDALDIVGYSYRTVHYDRGHRLYPEKMILGTENWVQWSEWKAVLEKPFVPGIFLWTGIDYLGESTGWPHKANSSGLLDTAGFRKPGYWFFKTLWQENEPQVFLATQPLEASSYQMQEGRVFENPDRPRDRTWLWPKLIPHWNYSSGEEVYVEVYSNCEAVELFLNGQSLGCRSLESCADRIMKWAVPFEPGTLKAVGCNGGKEMVFQTLETAAAPAAVQLTVDRAALTADGVDVAHCVAQLVDTEGFPVRYENRAVHFAVEGNAANIGVDNGAPDSTQDFKSDHCFTEQGRCLMVLQAGELPGTVRVTVSAEGLKKSAADIPLK